MTTSDFARAWARVSSAARELSQDCNSILDPFCRQNLYPYISRIKAEESILQKIETGRFDSFLKIDDIVAYTIIIPTRSHHSRVLEFLEREFTILDVKTRSRTISSPNEFRFDVTRVYAQRKKPDWDDRTDTLKYRMIVEIQVRTAIEHAWITALHDVTYKAEFVNWQRMRLASQTKAQVEMIDMVFTEFEKISEFVENQEWAENQQQRQIVTWLNEINSRGVIPSDAIPRDRLRFADNLLSVLTRSSRGNLTDTLAEIEKRIVDLSALEFPRSLTLFQVVVVAAHRQNALISGKPTHSHHVTETLLNFFPDAGTLTPRFSYEIS